MDSVICDTINRKVCATSKNANESEFNWMRH